MNTFTTIVSACTAASALMFILLLLARLWHACDQLEDIEEMLHKLTDEDEKRTKL